MARRTNLKAWDKRLLDRIRSGLWSADELHWTLAHLDERTPTLVIQEIHGKLIALQQQQPEAGAVPQYGAQDAEAAKHTAS